MSLSRLDNFLKNVRGNILYVNPNDLDATDAIENQGNSMGRPFKTIQRALVEAARFSYQSGFDNDRFDKTTILLSPGEHFVDNRPGFIPLTTNTFRDRQGRFTSDFTPYYSLTNFDVLTTTNELYKLNSVYGGVIIPRGVSIIGQDLRKTKIRPLYVPNPENDNIERSAVFRITGGSYFWQFSIFDANPNGFCYKDYTGTKFVPNFSHHKLTCFEYADGVNDVYINDEFISDTDYGRTDLDMYYEKVGLAYGPASGRGIEPDYPAGGLDIQARIDEFRIVGPTGGTTGVSSIKSGDGVIPSTTISVELQSPGIFGLNIDTAFKIDGMVDGAYNGAFVVSKVNTIDSTTGNVLEFEYNVSVAPLDPLENPSSASVVLDTDTVTSASPYIFNISLRSVYGMCGMHADGSKATGFKSMVVAQFTGVSLQKDENAFVKYDSDTGTFLDSGTVTNLSTDSRAQYKPDYFNFHIKASNDSICQLVSIFAIGFAQQFVVESGGDFSVTNSNSNFGQIALNGSGFRENSFSQDDTGYITNIIPPQEITSDDFNLEYDAIDVTNTVSNGFNNRLYLYQKNNQSIPPKTVIQGYRIGAKLNDTINVGIFQGGSITDYSAKIVMPNSGDSSSRKRSFVGRNVGTGNSIASNIITFTEDHFFSNGETVRIISDNARLPDGLEPNIVYNAIVDGLNSDQIKLATSVSEAISGNSININNLGGNLFVESRVHDKKAGDIGHPIQYDTSNSQWYINVPASGADNTITGALSGLTADATSRTYITRKSDSRNLSDKLYKFRYVIPSTSGVSARPPQTSFIIQESNDVSGVDDTEVQLQFNSSIVSMNNSNEFRNFRFIRDAVYDNNSGVNPFITYYTELPHDLTVGSSVRINNVTSANNLNGTANEGYNGEFLITSVPNNNAFVVSAVSDPGAFTNSTSLRSTSLPNFQRIKASKNYYVYDVDTIKDYESGVQDGVYYLTVIDATNVPSTAPFNNKDKFSFPQPISNLYPQYDRDNPDSDPDPAVLYSSAENLGTVIVDNPKNSITKSTAINNQLEFGVGVGLTDIVSSAAGTAHTIHTSVEHKLNRIVSVNITDAGQYYGNGSGGTEILYNAQLTNIYSDQKGTNASARITVNAAGELTNVIIMDGGSAYGIGQTLSVTGTATTTGFDPVTTLGRVTVSQIYDNVGDSVRISGVTSFTNSEYNQLYEITGISSATAIEVNSINTISNPSIDGLPVGDTDTASVTLTGAAVTVSAIAYNNTTGIATITTLTNHGFRANNQITISGADENLYNGNFIIIDNISLTQFAVNVGTSANIPATGGTIKAYVPGLIPQAGVVDISNENYGGRILNSYDNLTATLSAEIATTATDEINITNLSDLDLKIGDYIRIDDELMRVKTTVSSNSVRVFRGLFGTESSTHENGSVLRRISVEPLEFRRPSIMRASGHTFEYLGYGPGNYSTALPDRQDRQLTIKEQIAAQSFNSAGGITVFTGMNDRGDFFIGNKKISSNTGIEEVFNTPVPTVTGEDIFSGVVDAGIDVINPAEVTVSRGIKVEGGQSNSLLSQFDGPVLFSEKITSIAEGGVEASSIFLQGDATVSRKYTVGISTPTVAGNYGDLVFNATPSDQSNAGWIYTTESVWRKFGWVNDTFQSTDTYQNVSTVGMTLTCNFEESTIARTTSTNTSIINIENVPTTDERTHEYTVIMNASSAVANLAAIDFQINGTSLTSGGNNLRWEGGVSPTGTSSGYHVFDFVILRVGVSYEVIGRFQTYS